MAPPVGILGQLAVMLLAFGASVLAFNASVWLSDRLPEQSNPTVKTIVGSLLTLLVLASAGVGFVFLLKLILTVAETFTETFGPTYGVGAVLVFFIILWWLDFSKLWHWIVDASSQVLRPLASKEGRVAAFLTATKVTDRLLMAVGIVMSCFFLWAVLFVADATTRNVILVLLAVWLLAVPFGNFLQQIVDEIAAVARKFAPRGTGKVHIQTSPTTPTPKPSTTPPKEALSESPATPTPEVIPFGSVSLGTDRDGHHVTLDRATRNRHLYIIGRTGSGKSTLLRHLAMQDMAAGNGLAFLDPHGDVAQELAGYVPPGRLDDVIYFDPTDEHAPAFNLLAMPFESSKLTSDVMSAFKMFFGESSFGPRMEHLMRHALLTLLNDREPHSIADLRTLLVDEDYRDALAARVADDDLRSFWRDEYPNMSKDAAGPILNKIATVLVPGSALKRIFSARTNALDITAAMDSGKILLVNLSKGQLGEEPARLLGGLLTTAIAQAALARVRIPEPQRRDFYFYCDEFQNFAAIPSMESILSEARKYRLNLTLAHQTLGQLPPSLKSTITGNVGTLVAFGISAEDAAQMKRNMASTYERPAKRTPAQQERYDKWHAAYTAAAANVASARASCEAAEAAPSPERKSYLNNKMNEEAQTAHWKWKSEWRDVLRRAEDALKAQPPEPYQPMETYDWPDVADFVNLDTCNAFVRIGKPTNTRAVHVPFPATRPDPATHAAILERQRQRHLEQLEQSRPAIAPAPVSAPGRTTSPASSPPPSTSAPTPPPAKPTTDDPDDFLN